MPQNSQHCKEKLIKIIANCDIAAYKFCEGRIALEALFCAHQSELESAYVIRVLICC